MLDGQLACTHCRRRKVRCNRAVPICERCQFHHLECSYPRRQCRPSRRKPGLPTLNQNNTLSTRPRRFQHHEEQSATRVLPETQANTIYNVPNQYYSSPSCRPSTRPSGQVESPVSTDNSNVNLSATGPILDRSETAPLDFTSMLSCTVDKVQQLRKMHRFGARALTLESVTIPPESAKQWIHHYFTNIDGKLLPALVDRKLIDVMPDLIDMDHVHFDACMLMIYYCILWQGLFFHKANQSRDIDSHYARQVFICCKRTIPIWQREATGTITDFIAAMYMTQTATENFDFSLSWEMHKLACEYAQTLQMHNLDSLDRPGGQLSMSDHDRMGMWWLIHLDLFARLINDKPAGFSSQLNDWRVNMPRLAAESQERNEAVPALAFLVRSRLTFILISYFQVSEALKISADVLAAITPLCEDVEELFNEWKIEKWCESYRDGCINGWILGDLALSGYTCILFMLRKASLPQSTDHLSMLSDNDDMIPRSDLSIRTSRRILKLVHHMIYIIKLPGSEAMSLILGNYRAYIAHAHLASALMHDPTTTTAKEDLDLLQDVAECIDGLAKKVNEFVVLARAFKLVNDEVRYRVRSDPEISEQPIEMFQQ